jgi:hypothetical protein
MAFVEYEKYMPVSADGKQYLLCSKYYYYYYYHYHYHYHY